MITPRIWISKSDTEAGSVIPAWFPGWLAAGALCAPLWIGCAGSPHRADVVASAAPQHDSAAAPAVVKTVPVDTAFLSSDLASDAAEFIQMGRESLDDSDWFDAAEYFDSAMVQLTDLASSDSLSASMLAADRTYQDTVQTWLVQAVAQTTRLGTAQDLSDFINQQIEEVPDSALKNLDPMLRKLADRNFDLPLPSPLPPRVLQAIEVFTGPGRGYFTRWLARKSRYADLITRRLSERHMPKDLIYLAMVESGFNPKAWSHANASGLWQFVGSTARRYGLNDDWWVDPRRDPESSTKAALDYLEDLYSEFGDWSLAMAAYNCGEGRIEKLRQSDSTLGFWDMDLPEETRFYVPKILAAMIIGHNPTVFGFADSVHAPPLQYDTAVVQHAYSLHSIAKAVGVSEDSIRDLNPALRRWCTPPGRNDFCLKLPAGSRPLFEANRGKLDTAAVAVWRRHVVRSGDNLSTLAAHYGVSVASIQSANHLRGTFLRAGRTLILPVSDGAAQGDDAESSSPAKIRVTGRYKVQRGETLYDIARRFRVSVHTLRAANGMAPSTVLRAGRTLRIPQSEADAGPDRDAGRTPAPAPGQQGHWSTYHVRAGESLYSISRQLGVRQADLRHWNGVRGSALRAGQSLVYLAPQPAPDQGGNATSEDDTDEVREASAASVAMNIDAVDGTHQFYRVKAGDSLWDISVRFGKTVDELKRLNAHLTELLRPGQKIRIR